MAPPIRAVIFDLDGVLADSEPWWNKIDAQLLGQYGVSYGGEYHRSVLGVSYPLAIDFYKKTFRISAPAEEMMQRRGEIAVDFFASHIGLFPHTREILEELRRSRSPVRLGLATSSVSASARPFLDRHDLTNLFDVIITGDEVTRGKPDPEIYFRAAEKLGVKPDECLVVEDSLSGIAAGKAANMRVAAIPDRRFVDPKDYEAAADYVLNDISAVPPLVHSLAT